MSPHLFDIRCPFNQNIFTKPLFPTPSPVANLNRWGGDPSIAAYQRAFPRCPPLATPTKEVEAWGTHQGVRIFKELRGSPCPL